MRGTHSVGEAIDLAGAEPTEGRDAGQEVNEAVSGQVCGRQVQLLH